MTPGQRYALLTRASLALREAGCDDIDDQVLEVADTVWREMSEAERAEANARAAAHARGIVLGSTGSGGNGGPPRTPERPLSGTSGGNGSTANSIWLLPA